MNQVRVPALLLSLAFALAASQAQTSRYALSAQSKVEVFEDDHVRIPIPVGWKRTYHSPPTARDFYRIVNSDDPQEYSPHGTLLLYKEGYTLSLAYDGGHASGIIGGRSIELFRIPWSTGKTGDEWACEGSFPQIPQPATRALLFMNLLVDTDLEEVRKACNLPNLHDSLPDGKYRGDARWFGGYFTTAGSYFSDQDCGQEQCGELSYTLTTSAKRADQLPRADDAHLTDTIQQAIDIVNSIQYKENPPRQVSPFRVNLRQ